MLPNAFSRFVKNRDVVSSKIDFQNLFVIFSMENITNDSNKQRDTSKRNLFIIFIISHAFIIF